VWLLLAASVHAADWPAFLGPTGDGKSPEQGEFEPWGDNGPPLRWTLPVGNGYCAPSIAAGRLYLFDRHPAGQRLTCYDVAHARPAELWRFEYPSDFADQYGYDNGPRCCPVVDGDRVYLYGPEGILHCLNTADGSVIWKVDTAARFGVVPNFFGVGSTPVVEGDLLIAQVGGSPPDSPATITGQTRPNGSAVVAFDKRTGQVRYQIGDELASYAGPVLAESAGRRWCFLLARGGLLAFNPADGKIDFHYPWRASIVESVNAANPVVVGDQVFISETYGPGSSLLRFKPGGFEVIWKDEGPQRAKKMQAHWPTPIHVDGYLYGSSGRHSGNAELRCVQWSSGKLMWSLPGLTRSSLMHVNGHFVVLTEFGKLILLKVNPERPEALFSVTPSNSDGQPLIPDPAWAAPVLSDGRLYVRGKGLLACFQLLKKPQ
jgi:outer membrane protein assembly factor BamB